MDELITSGTNYLDSVLIVSDDFYIDTNEEDTLTSQMPEYPLEYRSSCDKFDDSVENIDIQLD